MSNRTTRAGRRGTHPHIGGLALAALGVVFGDIGTSPLYTFKTILDLTGSATSHDTILGLVSLLVWTLLLTTSLKYVTFVMRIDNDGEGGILALMALLGVKLKKRPGIVAVGLFGAALIYGDGIITPAISVLSALEGVKIAAPAFTPWVLPCAVAVLLALFAIQPMGTARIGQLFGPIMLVWFLAIGAMGLRGILYHPDILAAINPAYAVRYLMTSGYSGFLVLGGVFLCVTGAEALYADMGHFGRKPIIKAWYRLVLPTLVLNYAGQGAFILAGESAANNIFYRLCPAPLLLPLIGLATVATIIASQAIISGAYSMTRQAIQLGWLPRMHVTQTSSEGYGQIYIGLVNWTLMVLTVLLTVTFGSSDRLAAAYGIAVSLTMVLTTLLLFVAMREIWQWPLWQSSVVAGVFLVIDSTFLSANLLKIAQGGWIPLGLAAVIYGLMRVWHRGSESVHDALRELTEPAEDFFQRIAAQGVPRVPGSAIFLTKTGAMAPPIMVWHVKQNRALHQKVLALSVVTASKPWIEPADRLQLEQLDENFWRAKATYGFMETPDIPKLLEQANGIGCKLDLHDLVFYVGHETVRHRTDGKGIPFWEEELYVAMERNSIHVTDFFQLPRDRVVELGRQIEI